MKEIPKDRESDVQGCGAQMLARYSEVPLRFIVSPAIGLQEPFLTAVRQSGELSQEEQKGGPSPVLSRRKASPDSGTGPLIAGKIARKARVQPNDLVKFAGQAGTWKVVAPVNGSKADIRRSRGFDTRIVTARLDSLTVVRRAGSPGYSY